MTQLNPQSTDQINRIVAEQRFVRGGRPDIRQAGKSIAQELDRAFGTALQGAATFAGVYAQNKRAEEAEQAREAADRKAEEAVWVRAWALEDVGSESPAEREFEFDINRERYKVALRGFRGATEQANQEAEIQQRGEQLFQAGRAGVEEVGEDVPPQALEKYWSGRGHQEAGSLRLELRERFLNQPEDEPLRAIEDIAGELVEERAEQLFAGDDDLYRPHFVTAARQSLAGTMNTIRETAAQREAEQAEIAVWDGGIGEIEALLESDDLAGALGAYERFVPYIADRRTVSRGQARDAIEQELIARVGPKASFVLSKGKYATAAMRETAKRFQAQQLDQKHAATALGYGRAIDKLERREPLVSDGAMGRITASVQAAMDPYQLDTIDTLLTRSEADFKRGEIDEARYQQVRDRLAMMRVQRTALAKTEDLHTRWYRGLLEGALPADADIDHPFVVNALWTDLQSAANAEEQAAVYANAARNTGDLPSVHREYISDLLSSNNPDAFMAGLTIIDQLDRLPNMGPRELLDAEKGDLADLRLFAWRTTDGDASRIAAIDSSLLDLEAEMLGRPEAAERARQLFDGYFNKEADRISPKISDRVRGHAMLFLAGNIDRYESREDAWSAAQSYAASKLREDAVQIKVAGHREVVLNDSLRVGQMRPDQIQSFLASATVTDWLEARVHDNDAADRFELLRYTTDNLPYRVDLDALSPEARSLPVMVEMPDTDDVWESIGELPLPQSQDEKETLLQQLRATTATARKNNKRPWTDMDLTPFGTAGGPI